MEFTDLMEDCTAVTCSEFWEVALPIAVLLGLVLAVWMVRVASRRRATALLKLSRHRGR